MNAQEVKEVVLAQLQALGWTLTGGSAIALKTFDTAVGPKTAHAYLSEGDEYNRTLMGDYQSEGRNILEPRGVLLPRTTSLDEVQQLVTQFSTGVDAAVGQSYAARLLRSD